jgi:predicted ATPase
VIHLREARLAPARGRHGFPFDLPVVATLRKLPFDAPVTMLVGENGSGKSTIL